MKTVPLKATKREILGKKVNKLRREGTIPGHVFGKKLQTEHVSVKAGEFLKVYKEAGETGLVDLKIGEKEIRPVLIRQIQTDPVRGDVLHIDFYQVNLLEKTTVNVPILLAGEEPEIVHSGEAVVIQPMMEVSVEALPGDLPENSEVDITTLNAIDDAITIAKLVVPEGVTLLADPESVVVKLDTAITEEMKKLMEEEAAAAAAQVEAAAVEGETPAPAEGPLREAGEAVEGKVAEGEAAPEEVKTEEQPKEEAPKE